MQAVGKKNRTSLHSLYDFVLMTRGILCIGTGGPNYKRTRGLLCFGISILFKAATFNYICNWIVIKNDYYKLGQE